MGHWLMAGPRHDKEGAIKFLFKLLDDGAAEAFIIALPQLLELLPLAFDDAFWAAGFYGFVCWTLVDLGAACAQTMPDCRGPIEWAASSILRFWDDMPAEFKIKTKCAYLALKCAWENSWEVRGEEPGSDEDEAEAWW
jgi:hypothetical protein